MTQELLQKLKDNGFPQEDSRRKLFYGFTGLDPHTDPTVEINHVTSYIYEPTLEELIQECHFKTFHLWNDGEKWLCNNGEYVFGMSGSIVPWNASNGSTPSEAVANLWLSINKK